MVQDAAVTSASNAARDLLSAALDELKKTTIPTKEEKPRLFFPKGIELVSITVKVTPVEVVLKVAGEKGISGLLHPEPSVAVPVGEGVEEVGGGGGEGPS